MSFQPPVTLSDAEIAAVRASVVFEDAHVLVLDKPSGLSSQGGRIKANTLDDLLWAFARSNGKRPHLVHRLDRDTSGVILAAKTKPAAGFLGKAIQSRKLTKTYLALVETPPAQDQGVIRRALLRQEIGRESYMRAVSDDTPGAQASESRFRVLSRSDQGALVELEPHTGRMHQLRVHMADLGSPLVGDARYGGALTLAGRKAARLMLHAARLRFPHPEGGIRDVEAPLPDDFGTLMAAAALAAPERSGEAGAFSA
ncbi:MAG: RluA family pseudouridine synthase [Alphaproteobacteria bacterium]|nr:RluA family pseudouridine synthase [Alphaproteobacteria bacterium]